MQGALPSWKNCSFLDIWTFLLASCLDISMALWPWNPAKGWSHTTSHTWLITSELITAPLLTPDITSPLLTPHFSHLPEVHIKLRYMKAWHVGLSGPLMFRLRSTYVLSYVWHMFHIRFTYVSFMFHICFYLCLDIVYVYVMPRPPSIETIPGAPLDQAKAWLSFRISLLLKFQNVFSVSWNPWNKSWKFFNHFISGVKLPTSWNPLFDCMKLAWLSVSIPAVMKFR